ncbi:MAG: PPC domain-containing protein [Acholeplasmataceae bacterium]|nr:PPC domain-containing protein [Acholeplasmataceae bacterium]
MNVGGGSFMKRVWLKNMLYIANGLLALSSTDLDLRLYNPSGNLVDSSSSSNYNIEYIRYTAGASGYYTLKVYQWGNYATIGTEHIGVAYWYN